MKVTPTNREIKHHHYGPHAPEVTVECIQRPEKIGMRDYYVIGYHGFPYYGSQVPKSNIMVELAFQKGAPQIAGNNGITREALLAVVIDSLEVLQAGPYPCEENAKALACLKEGIEHLHARSRRMQQTFIERDV